MPPVTKLPAWYHQLLIHGPFHPPFLNRTLPLLLALSFEGHPVQYTSASGWHYLTTNNDNDTEINRFPGQAQTTAPRTLLTKAHLDLLTTKRLRSEEEGLTELAEMVAERRRDGEVETRLRELAKRVFERVEGDGRLREEDPWLRQLDWTPKTVQHSVSTTAEDDAPTPAPKRKKAPKAKPAKPPPVYWPKWYWELTKPKKGCAPGSIDITARSRVTPILLKLSWKDSPLFHSREHGWTYRVSPLPSSSSSPDDATPSESDTNDDFLAPPPPKSRQTPLSFHDPTDETLMQMSLQGGFTFYKVPHKDGESANVGSPLGKSFIKYSQDGTLKSPGDLANSALDMNAQCSYWISARDRVLKQVVVWDREGKMGMEGTEFKEKGRTLA